MKSIVRICCFLLTCLALQAQAQATAHLEADSLKVETGNPFLLHLSVPGVNLPDTLNIGAWQEFVAPQNILAQTPWVRKGSLLTCDVSLQFFEADTITLSPLTITFRHGDTARTNPLRFIVYPTPSPDDLADMAPIKDISHEPVLWTDYIPWAAAVLAVLAVLGLLFWWYSRKQKGKARSRLIGLQPHELALKKLELLLQKAYWRHGAVKEHCAELTFILREYLEKRYEVRALESTSEELMAQLKTTEFPQELKADLGNILSQADLAKFAKAIPPEEFYLYSLDFAQALVTRTIPAPPVEASAENPTPS